MKQLATIWRTALAMLALCLVTGCTDDLGPQENNVGGNTSVRISLQTPEFSQVDTRAISNEGTINDLNIVVIKEGVLNKVVYLDNMNFAQAVDVQGLPALAQSTFDDVTGKLVEDNVSILLFFANVGDLSSKWTESTTDYATIRDYTTELTKEELLKLEYIPMYGTYTKGLVAGVTNQINVSLTRALAKISFTVNTDNFTLKVGEELSSVVVKDIVLHNVPLTVTFPGKTNRPALPVSGKNGVWPEAQVPYPAYEAAKFISLSKAEADEWSGNTTDNKFVAYMPENARGSYDNVENYEQKKNPATWMGIDGLTYIKLTLNYTTKTSVIRDVIYKIYLGGNNTGDMNIRANAQYNITANIYGDNQVQVNVEVKDLFDLGKVMNSNNETLQSKAQPIANSYMVDATNSTLKDAFYLNLMQARQGWTEIEAELKDGKPYVEEMDKLLRAGDWEIVTLWTSQDTDGTIDEAYQIKGTTVDTDVWKVDANNSALAGLQNYFAKLSFGSSVTENGHNAVIVLKAKETLTGTYTTIAAGDKLWSWHIWLTNYAPGADQSGTTNGQVHTYFGSAFQTGGLYEGCVMMDRNLGATYTQTTTDAISQPQTNDAAKKLFGLYYQFGRKDPFQYQESGSTDLMTPTVNQSESNLILSVHNPDKFFNLGDGVTGNWTKEDNYWWGTATSTKTAFDPCPPGWRMPVGGSTAINNPWAGFGNDNGSTTTSSEAAGVTPTIFKATAQVDSETMTDGRMYKYPVETPSTQAWYPVSGLRYCSSGNMTNVGSIGYCWSAARSSQARGYYLYFNSSSVNPANTTYRAYGFPVRCVREK